MLLKRMMLWLVSMILMIVLIMVLGYYTRPIDKETSMWKNYYQAEENTRDVLLVGSSAVYRYWLPYEAYENHGFTSEMVWGAVQDWMTTPYLLKEALKTQSPDVVVVEVRRLLRLAEIRRMNEEKKDEMLKGQAFHTRYCMSSMKLSMNKLDMIWNLFGDASLGEKLEMLFPFLEYHGQILKETPQAFWNREKKTPVMANMGLTVPIVKPQQWNLWNQERGFRIHEDILEALDEVARICKENDAEVLFVLVPYFMNPAVQELNQELLAYMAKNDYNYVDMASNMIELGFDPETDFYNAGHVNVSGAEKVTEYIGAYLQEQYGVAADLTESQKGYWEEAARMWNARKKYLLHTLKKDEMTEGDDYESDES